MFRFKVPDFNAVIKKGVDERLASGLFQKDREEAEKKERERARSWSSLFTSEEKDEPKKRRWFFG